MISDGTLKTWFATSSVHARHAIPRHATSTNVWRIAGSHDVPTTDARGTVRSNASTATHVWWPVGGVHAASRGGCCTLLQPGNAGNVWVPWCEQPVSEDVWPLRAGQLVHGNELVLPDGILPCTLHGATYAADEA